jgi:uncharacterized lipoprotein YehR (DUF1307 family)
MKKPTYLLFAVASLLFGACQDVTDIVNAEDQLVAISLVDLEFPFQEVSTFSLNDTIYEIKIDALGGTTKTKIIATYQKDVIIKQMEDRGFTYIPLKDVTETDRPELYIELVYVENKYVQVSGFGWWYDYYDPYWFDYYGPYYPFYPVSYTTITSYTAKSFIMDCMYFREKPDNKYKAESCFFGLVRGVANNYKEEDIAKYINQCFEQTPELARN